MLCICVEEVPLSNPVRTVGKPGVCQSSTGLRSLSTKSSAVHHSAFDFTIWQCVTAWWIKLRKKWRWRQAETSRLQLRHCVIGFRRFERTWCIRLRRSRVPQLQNLKVEDAPSLHNRLRSDGALYFDMIYLTL